MHSVSVEVTEMEPSAVPPEPPEALFALLGVHPVSAIAPIDSRAPAEDCGDSGIDHKLEVMAGN